MDIYKPPQDNRRSVILKFADGEQLMNAMSELAQGGHMNRKGLEIVYLPPKQIKNDPLSHCGYIGVSWDESPLYGQSIAEMAVDSERAAPESGAERISRITKGMCK